MTIMKYKIITAAPSLATLENEAIQQLTSAGAAQSTVMEAKNQFNKIRDMDPGKYQENIRKIVDNLLKEEAVASEIASKEGLSIGSATTEIDKIVKKYKLGRPDTVNLLDNVLKVSEGFGFSKNEAIKYLEIVLKKFGDMGSTPEGMSKVAEKIQSDFQEMQKLSKDAGLSPIEIFDIFYSAMVSGNFKPVWAMVAVVPILKINFLNKDASKVQSIAKNATALIEKTQMYDKPLSNAGLIVKNLFDSSNQMKNAFNPILKYLAETMINRQIAYNNIAKKDFLRDPNHWKDLLDYHQDMDADFKNIRDRHFLINRDSPFVPATDVSPSQSKRGSSVNKKIRIVVSAPTTPTSSQPNERVESAKERSIKLQVTLLNLSLTKIKKLIESMDAFIPGAATESAGIAGDIITTFLDTSTFSNDYEELKKEISEFRKNRQALENQIRPDLNNASLPVQVLTLIREKTVEIDAMKKIDDRDHNIALKKFGLINLALPYLKAYEDKSKTYTELKAKLKPATAKFKVILKVFNPQTNSMNNVPFSRGEFVLMVKQLGDELVLILRTAASKFALVPDTNARRSATRMFSSANKLEAENQEWADENFKVQAPTVYEPR